MVPQSGWFAWVILPLLIFLARIMDVSVGTVRLIFVSRGLKYLAPIAGFFEVLIWILAIGQIMQNLSNPLCYVAYAGGFATGNFIGIMIVERLSLGMVLVRIITPKPIDGLVECLKERQYGVTSIDGQGANGPVQVVFTIVPRREAGAVVTLIKRLNPHAFYTIEEVDHVERGVFPITRDWRHVPFLGLLRPFRKGK
ncbi:MAG: hypothetical protein A2Y77_08670 [Planctomycetes bacterium RBG_13_62_9]|nr:MAG: hypothetical protein A2Y77_08670 [Planctomycetes bacterium RBG_13_62_9]